MFECRRKELDGAGGSPGRLACGGLGQPAEAAFAASEFLHGGCQIGGIKFRPHAGREKQFGVGRFPQHEIAQAMIASSANQQVHIGGGLVSVSHLAEALARIRCSETSRLESIQQAARRIASREE